MVPFKIQLCIPRIEKEEIHGMVPEGGGVNRAAPDPWLMNLVRAMRKSIIGLSEHGTQDDCWEAEHLSVADADCRWSPAMSLGETRLVCPEVLARRPGNGVEGSVHAPERATDTATRVAGARRILQERKCTLAAKVISKTPPNPAGWGVNQGANASSIPKAGDLTAKWKSQIQWEGRKRKIESRTVGVRAEEMPNNGLIRLHDGSCSLWPFATHSGCDLKYETATGLAGAALGGCHSMSWGKPVGRSGIRAPILGRLRMDGIPNSKSWHY
ncbi:hypothetical protein An14g06690 [Aspergillus niger]|uniref:Uncharacterized protein n=2 Tax=Aspergillus niger TaxID=5061 RepID=A2R462_ASPNC|nr:hypothetical protein An14g06690 [Aspergillus niger]CAK46662.1 hypothetical protein An14g06690 [Aspergillus niger]